MESIFVRVLSVLVVLYYSAVSIVSERFWPISSALVPNPCSSFNSRLSLLYKDLSGRRHTTVLKDSLRIYGAVVGPCTEPWSGELLMLV